MMCTSNTYPYKMGGLQFTVNLSVTSYLYLMLLTLPFSPDLEIYKTHASAGQKTSEGQESSETSVGKTTMGRSKPKKPKGRDHRMLDDMLDHRLRGRKLTSLDLWGLWRGAK